MTVKRVLAVCAVCAILCMTLGIFSQVADAQDSSAAKSVDRDLAMRRGVSGSLASGDKQDEDKGKGPTKPQMAVGIGSFIVMIIVVKWL